MELNSATSRHLIYRAIYILTQLAAPGVRGGINPPARPGDYRRGHQRYRHQISRGRQRRIQANFAEQADCWSGISRICRKIDSWVNVRTNTQPPGYGSEPHLDFIVTDLDWMLAQLCGPDRKIIRLRDKRGIYLFLIEITALPNISRCRRRIQENFDCWS